MTLEIYKKGGLLVLANREFTKDGIGFSHNPIAYEIRDNGKKDLTEGIRDRIENVRRKKWDRILDWKFVQDSLKEALKVRSLSEITKSELWIIISESGKLCLRPCRNLGSAEGFVELDEEETQHHRLEDMVEQLWQQLDQKE